MADDANWRAGLLRKIIAGDGSRKTRLHDELGNFVPLDRLVLNGSRALVGTVLRHTIGYRPERPWISYAAARYLASFLTQDSRVLEFGSGMSTAWYAKHAGEVVSIEHYRPWFESVEAILSKSNISNVRYRHADSFEEYVRPTADEAEGGFDLIMIDGNHRDVCLENNLSLLRRGGIIYYDNSDRGVSPTTGNTPEAVGRMKALARSSGAEMIEFTDFAPAQFVVQQGLLVRTA